MFFFSIYFCLLGSFLSRLVDRYRLSSIFLAILEISKIRKAYIVRRYLLRDHILVWNVRHFPYSSAYDTKKLLQLMFYKI